MNGWYQLNDNLHTDSPAIAAMPSRYRLSVLAGALAAFALIGLAITIMVQLLSYPGGASQPVLTTLSDARIIRTITFSLFQATLSTVISLAIGIMLAWSLANCPKLPFRNVLIALISSALVLPTLVIVLGIVSIYGRAGWLAQLSNALLGEQLPFSIYGLGGILLAHTFFNASFAARLLLHRFEAIAIEKQKLGFSLGMGFVRKIIVVDFPAIRPALPGLALTIFLLCFTSFAIVLTLGGHPAFNTLEVAIYEAVKFDFDLPRAFQLAMVQIVICLVLVLVANAKSVEIPPPVSSNPNHELQHLAPRHILIMQHAFILVFALFFVAPLAAILFDGFGADMLAVLHDAVFQHAFITSIIIATLAAFIALFFSLALSSALVSVLSKMRAGNLPLARLLKPVISASSMLYLVFPALVMGLGFFLLSRKIGGSPALWAGGVVITANALMAIPFGVAILYPAIHAAANKNDRLCASLGLGAWQRQRLVNWPMLKNEITFVLALSFCLSLGDLGVIALFGSEELQTLPWLLYQKFGSYRTDDAGVIALVLLLLVITIFFTAQSFANKKQAR